jgi:hypothetical protein
MAESAPKILIFSTENVINAYYNEPILWNSELNATEEAKELAWCRLGDQFGLKGAGKFKLLELGYLGHAAHRAVPNILIISLQLNICLGRKWLAVYDKSQLL